MIHQRQCTNRSLYLMQDMVVQTLEQVANGYKAKKHDLEDRSGCKSHTLITIQISKFTIQDYLIHTQALLSVLILPMQLAQTDSTVFISNSAGSSATGTETLYNSKGYKSSTGLTSYNWSATIHPYIRSATGFTNRGLVNRTGLAVLRHTKTSSTLTEIGFISNKSEAKKMNSNLTNYGKAVYNSTKASFSKNPTGR